MTRVEHARRMLGVKHPVLDVVILPETKGVQYFRVKVFPLKTTLHRYIQVVHGKRSVPLDVWGFFGVLRAGHCLGEVLFCTNGVDDSIVSHEFLHAIHYWCEFKRFHPKNIITYKHPTHERVACALDYMIDRFWYHFTEAGWERKECWGWNQKTT